MNWIINFFNTKLLEINMDSNISNFSGSIATQLLREEHRNTYNILIEYENGKINDEKFIEHIDFLLSHHFPIEEKILFPAFEPFLKIYLPYIEPIKMVLAEHNGVRNLFRKYNESKNNDFLKQIKDLLLQHIYREENGLFKQIDTFLPEDKKEEVFFKINHFSMEK